MPPLPTNPALRPSTLSLPSGAGSIEGLGESFEPQLNTGSSIYGVGISLPPGRAGLQPKVQLAYNSGTGNSSAGVGWSCEFPTIKRQTDKEFPTYTLADVSVVMNDVPGWPLFCENLVLRIPSQGTLRIENTTDIELTMIKEVGSPPAIAWP